MVGEDQKKEMVVSRSFFERRLDRSMNRYAALSRRECFMELPIDMVLDLYCCQGSDGDNH